MKKIIRIGNEFIDENLKNKEVILAMSVVLHLRNENDDYSIFSYNYMAASIFQRVLTRKERSDLEIGFKYLIDEEYIKVNEVLTKTYRIEYLKKFKNLFTMKHYTLLYLDDFQKIANIQTKINIIDLYALYVCTMRCMLTKNDLGKYSGKMCQLPNRYFAYKVDVCERSISVMFTVLHSGNVFNVYRGKFNCSSKKNNINIYYRPSDSALCLEYIRTHEILYIN